MSRGGVRGFRRTKLAFDIVETADVLGKGPLEGADVAIELRGVSVNGEGPWVGERVVHLETGRGRARRGR